MQRLQHALWFRSIQMCHRVRTRFFSRCNISRKAAALEVAVDRRDSEAERKDHARFNKMQIQMIPEKLRDSIFGQQSASCMDEERIDAVSDKEQECIENLKKFNLWDKNSYILPDVDLEMPPLCGTDVEEHFQKIAVEQSGEYFSILLKLSKAELPKRPKKWSKQAGWTKYTSEKIVKVDYPDSNGLVFDCEVLVPEGNEPIMAVAVSKDCWYSWCSERVSDHNMHPQGFEAMIPLEMSSSSTSLPSDSCERIIVGHNVSFDRARVREQYFLEQTKARFVDTMSMHMAVSGFTGSQRMLYKSAESKKDSTERSSWLGAGTLNNLNDVHHYYCGSALDKLPREVFVEGTIQDVRTQFDVLMDYCSNDVEATHNVLKKILPMFCDRFPHPVTFAAMLEMSLMYLPTNKCWERYIDNAEATYSDLNKELKSTLTDIANDACSMIHDEKYKSDPWLWDLDWSTQTFKLLKQPRKNWTPPSVTEVEKMEDVSRHLSNEESAFLNISHGDKSYTPSAMMKSILDTASLLPKVSTQLQGYPKWYRELCMREKDEGWVPGPVRLSTLTKVTPKLLRMTWNGFPLHHDRAAGWGYVVPTNDTGFITVKKDEGVDSALDDEIDSDMPESQNEAEQEPITVESLPEGHLFYRLPHKGGTGNNVGSPLSHDFQQKMDDGILKSADNVRATRCLQINKSCSYWRISKKRICSQIAVELPRETLPEIVKKNENGTREQYSAILPLTVVFGTVTRRAVEPTWLTASNVREKSVGSELKAMVQAPPGYTFVGADVDSQELWIASLLGDADSVKEHGCTPISWMTLQGSKSNGTDLHSKTAEAIDISRDQAKAFNYARIYGAGQKLARHLLRNFNYNVSTADANRRISKLYQMTKGSRKYILSMDGRYYAKRLKTGVNPAAVRGGLVTLEELKALEHAANKAFGHLKVVRLKDLIAGRVWNGGAESEMFNRLEKIARNYEPRTPVLGARISRALEPSKVQDNFQTSRMNWVVQSSAADYLHLMLVCMKWLIEKYSIRARFTISIHDEIRYMCIEEDRYRTALALQISNFLTRCMFAHKLGMADLPLGVAFFSSVEIDKAMRKQQNDDCVTPSNPLGLEKVCGIGPGESVDIHKILEETDAGQALFSKSV